MKDKIDADKYMAVLALAVVRNKPLADHGCPHCGFEPIKPTVLDYADGNRISVPPRLFGIGRLGYDPEKSIEEQVRERVDSLFIATKDALS